MLRSRPHALYGLAVSALALALCIDHLCDGTVLANNTGRRGGINESKAESIADGVVQGILPGGATLVEDDPTDITRPDGTTQWVDLFTYTGARGQPHVIITVDAVRDEVLYLYMGPGASPPRGHVDSAAAIQAAQNWMRVSGIASQSPWWSLACSPEHRGGDWLVCWRGADRAALVAVDSSSGRLRRAYTTRTPPYGPAWFPEHALAALKREGLPIASPHPGPHALR